LERESTREQEVAVSPSPVRAASAVEHFASVVGNRAVGRMLASPRGAHIFRGAMAVRPLSGRLLLRVNTGSPDYLRGYNDGRAGSDPSPGPMAGDALDDYNEGYRAGRTESDNAHASLPPLAAPPSLTPGAAEAPPPASARPAVDQHDRDRVQSLLTSAGVSGVLPTGPTVTVADAQRILGMLVAAHPSLVGLGPRMVAVAVFQNIVSSGADTTIGVIASGLTRFERIVVLRPDGYIASALTGRAIQRAGAMQFAEGALRSGNFQTGRFYYSYAGVFYNVDSQLQPTGNSIGELALEHDVVNSALDGVADAVVAMVAGLRQLITHPIDSIAALRNLPGAVGQLISNAPEYWELFKAMPLNDQVREVSKIITTLVTLYGTAAGTATRVAAAAGDIGNMTVNVMRITSGGELAMARVAVPVGTVATALSGGPGGVYVLHMANSSMSNPGGGSTGGSSSGGGGSAGGGGGGRLIVAAGRTLSAEETAIANQLVSEGRVVEVLAESNVQGVRTADFLVDGVRTELKSISNITSSDPSGALARRILDGAGQAPNIIADARQQAGITQELAERAARRAYGADRAARIQNIRIVGQGFDVRIPRAPAPPL
jgi:hypothetical protein